MCMPVSYTHLDVYKRQVTGGALRVKAPLTYRAQNQDYNEKADQLRLYSGVKFLSLIHILSS